MTPDLAFSTFLLDHPEIEAAGPLGAAVSGGGDSVALLLLAEEVCRRWGISLHVVTVDHGLRPESANEAAYVASLCRAARVPCTILCWDGWDGQGNLQAAARRARRRMIAEWAAGQGIGAVLTGHTRDDQAETVLLRLSRGSGVDGLAGIAPVLREGGVTWGRPLLQVGRDELRAWLSGRGATWIDDPSNEDDRFDRVRARKMLAALADLGLTAERLAATAGRMQAAGAALARATGDLARQAARVDRGDLVLDLPLVWASPADVQRRLMSAALQWVAGQTYRPRYDALLRLMRDVTEGRGGTLHGCRILRQGPTARVTREAKAVAGAVARPGQAWDGRWIVTGPARPGDAVRALGGAATAIPDWREARLPLPSLAASPAVWRDGVPIAAPLAGFGAGWTAELAKGRDEFAPDTFAH